MNEKPTTKRRVLEIPPALSDNPSQTTSGLSHCDSAIIWDVASLKPRHKRKLKEFKQCFVIQAVRATARTIRSGCWFCKRRALSQEVPEMSTLPTSRLAALLRPFLYTSVNYFGSLQVKHGRRVYQEKCCVIFICLATTVIYLELTPLLSTGFFILNLIAHVSSPTVKFLTRYFATTKPTV